MSPPVVFNRDGKKAYACSTPLLVNLAVFCNAASNAAIRAVVEREGLFNPAIYRLDMTSMIDRLDAVEHMSDWAHDMAFDALQTLDYDAISAELGQSRVTRLQSLLRAPPTVA